MRPGGTSRSWPSGREILAVVMSSRPLLVMIAQSHRGPERFSTPVLSCTFTPGCSRMDEAKNRPM